MLPLILIFKYHINFVLCVDGDALDRCTGQIPVQPGRKLQPTEGFQPGVVHSRRFRLAVLLATECQNTFFQPFTLSDTACFYLLICIAGQLSSQKILHHSLLPSLRPFKLQVQPAQLRRPGCDLFLCSVKEMLCHLYSVHSLLNFLVNQLGQGIQQNTLLMSVAAGGQNAGVVQPTNDSCVAYALQLLLKD